MTYKYKEIEPPKYRGMKPAVRNGNLSLSEEHYWFVNKKPHLISLIVSAILVDFAREIKQVRIGKDTTSIS